MWEDKEDEGAGVVEREGVYMVVLLGSFEWKENGGSDEMMAGKKSIDEHAGLLIAACCCTRFGFS